MSVSIGTNIVDFRDALIGLNNRNLMIVPKYMTNNNNYYKIYSRGDIQQTKQWWDAVSWNPPGPEYTPDASPKPSWEEIVNIGLRYKAEILFNEYMSRIRPKLEKYFEGFLWTLKEVSGIPIEHDITQEMDFSTALSHITNSSLRAGENLTPTVSRNRDQSAQYLYTIGQLETVVDKMAKVKQILESAKNLYYDRLSKLRDITSGTSSELLKYTSFEDKVNARLAAYDKHIELIHFYESRAAFKDALEQVEYLIPTDPDIAKIVLKERIEAIATAKQKEIMTISGEAATMLSPGCVEEADALQELALLRRQGSIRIDAAIHVSQMEMIVDTFEKSVNDIKVLHTPDWDWVSGGGFAQTPESDPAVIGWDTTKFPMTLSITSDVSKYGDVGVNTTINNIPINSNSPFQIPTVPDANNQVQLTDNTGGNLAFGIYKLKIFAVNNCGPGRLNVDIEHPEQKISDPGFATAGVQDSTWSNVDGIISPLAKGIAFEANFATNAVILSESIPIVLKARYDISLTAEKTRGSRLFAGCVQFLQRDGTPITATTYGLDKYAYPNGWIAIGDYFFWNDGITTKQTYTFTIGRGTDSIGRVPRGAKSMKVGVAILPDQTVNDVCKITLDNLSVDELIWYEPPIGS